jgi:hypothetical protein
MYTCTVLHSRLAAGLPAIFSPKRGFGYFGVPPDTAGTVLWVGSSASDLQVWFASVAPVTKFDVRLAIIRSRFAANLVHFRAGVPHGRTALRALESTAENVLLVPD